VSNFSEALNASSLITTIFTQRLTLPRSYFFKENHCLALQRRCFLNNFAQLWLFDVYGFRGPN
jgi:hypothetical protein